MFKIIHDIMFLEVLTLDKKIKFYYDSIIKLMHIVCISKNINFPTGCREVVDLITMYQVEVIISSIINN